jgi:hypothetical protein
MDPHTTHDRDVVAADDMAGEHHVVGDDAAAAEVHIVANVGVDHQQVV